MDIGTRHWEFRNVRSGKTFLAKSWQMQPLSWKSDQKIFWPYCVGVKAKKHGFKRFFGPPVRPVAAWSLVLRYVEDLDRIQFWEKIGGCARVRSVVLAHVDFGRSWQKWPYLKINEPTRPAHQMKADAKVTSNIEKKLAEKGRDWPKLAQNGQKWPKFNVIRAILSCTSNESWRRAELEIGNRLA